MTLNPQYRYDNLQFSSVIPNFINTNKLTTSIACSGTYANGGGANFTGNVTLSNTTSFYDVYFINQNTNHKISALATGSNVEISIIWQYESSETVQNSISLDGSILTAEISLFNGTGSSLTIVSQTYTLEVIEYQIANFTQS